jgi:hypothetical protein
MEKYFITKVLDIEPYRDHFVRFGERNHAPIYTNARIDWLYCSRSEGSKNPCGPTDTWLAITEGKGDVVGCGSLYPWTFYCGGMPTPAVVAIDFRVDDHYRVFGPALGIQRASVSACREKRYEIAFVYPNEESCGVFRRSGYQSIGHSKVWIRILTSKGRLGKFTSSRLFRKVLTPLIDGILSAIHLVRYRAGYRNYRSETVDWCSDSFNHLWEREKKKYDLLPEKTAAYLNWRYSSHPSKKHSYYCLLDKRDSMLHGYVLYSREADDVIIKDIFPPSERWLDPLLWHFISAMKHLDAEVIRFSFFGSEDFIRTIRRYGFIERGTAREYLFYFKPESAGKYMPLLQARRSVFLFFG